MNEAIFLAAIEEQPSDLSRYHIYADWLDEQGRTEEAAALRRRRVYKFMDMEWIPQDPADPATSWNAMVALELVESDDVCQLAVIEGNRSVAVRQKGILAGGFPQLRPLPTIRKGEFHLSSPGRCRVMFIASDGPMRYMAIVQKPFEDFQDVRQNPVSRFR